MTRLENLLLDARQAWRMLARTPAFTVVAVLTLTIGIGANTAIFTIVHRVLLRPLAYAHPDKLMAFDTVSGGLAFPLAPAEYFEFRNLTRSFAAVGAYTTKEVNLSHDARAHRLRAVFADGELFRALELRAQQGRVFTTAESEVTSPWYPGDEPPPADVAVLSHDAWQSAFGGAPVIGTHVDIDGRRREIVGILPSGADLRDERIDVWLPLGLNPSTRDFRGYHVLSVIGRLRDSVNADQAHAELLTLMSNWAARTGLPESEHVFSMNPDPRRYHELRMTPLRDAVLGTAGRMIWALQAAVAIVLLIVCANLGNLLLARAEARRREYAVRLALGAGGGRLLRQSLVEAVVLATIAAGLGLVAAQAGVKAILLEYPNALPRGAEVSMDGRTAWFAVGVSLLAAVVFSLAPAGYARSRQLAAVLSNGRDRGSSAVRHHVRRALVIAQVGLAVVLVFVATLFVRTVRNLATVDEGFDRSRLVTFTIAAPDTNFRVGRMPVYQRVLDTIRQRPGVERATAMAELPPNQQFFSESTLIEEYAPAFQRPLVNVDFYQSVLSDYFETMGIPIVRGRSFRTSDSDPGAMVVVVNERLADTFWKGRDPIGQHIKPAWGKWVPWFTVIGVARDVRQAGVERPAGTEMYFFVNQMSRAPAPLGRTPEKVNVVLRTGLSLASLAPLVQRAVHDADPTVPVSHLRDMETVFADSIERPRLLAQLVGAFSATALLLAAIGTYGLLAYMALQRRREIGVRMAVGATARHVIELIVSQGLRLTAVGVAIGLVAAMAIAGLLRSLLFGVQPFDVPTMAGVATGMLLVGIVACLVPAWRASHLDPNDVLRADA